MQHSPLETRRTARSPRADGYVRWCRRKCCQVLELPHGGRGCQKPLLVAYEEYRLADDCNLMSNPHFSQNSETEEVSMPFDCVALQKRTALDAVRPGVAGGRTCLTEALTRMPCETFA